MTAMPATSTALSQDEVNEIEVEYQRASNEWSAVYEKFNTSLLAVSRAAVAYGDALAKHGELGQTLQGVHARRLAALERFRAMHARIARTHRVEPPASIVRRLTGKLNS